MRLLSRLGAVALAGTLAAPAQATVFFGSAQLATATLVEMNIRADSGTTMSLEDDDQSYDFTDSLRAVSTSAMSSVASAGASANATNSNTLTFVSAAQGVFGFNVSANATVIRSATPNGFVSDAQASTSYFLSNYYSFATNAATTIDLVFTASGINTSKGILGPIAQSYYLYSDTSGMLYGNENVLGAGSRRFDLTAGQYTLFFSGPTNTIPLVSQSDVGAQSASYTGSLAFVVGAQTVNGGVPEPATWLMMLLGFGSMGYVMRLRPKAAAHIRFI